MEFLTAVDFFDLSQEMFCVVGADGYFNRVNAAFAQNTGYSQSHFSGRTVLSVIDYPEAENSESFYQKLLSGNAPTTEFRCSDGIVKWFSWSATQDPQTSLLYILLRDVSKEKLLEEQLKRASLLKDSVLDSSVDLICSFDKQKRFVLVSKSAETLLGYRPEEMIGRNFDEFVFSDDKTLTAEVAASLMSGGELTNFENRYVHKDGHIVPIIWAGRWSQEDELFYCSARNATERIKQEEQRRLSERRMKGLVQTGSDLICILNAEFEVGYVSPTVSSILGYDPEKIVGTSMSLYVPEEYEEILRSGIQQVFQQYRVELPPFKVFDAKGAKRTLKAVATNLFHEEAIQGIVINARDVTAELEVEEQKASANRRLQNLIENYTQGYFSLDKDWIIRGVNPTALRILGVAEENVLNRSIKELFPSESVFYEYYECAIRENRFVEFEERSAQNRWFQISAYPYEGCLTVFFKETTQEKLQCLIFELEREIVKKYLENTQLLRECVDLYVNGLYNICQMKCVVSLYDKKEELLKPFSYPPLLADFVKLRGDGIPLATLPSVTQEAFYIPDVQKHPIYQAHTSLLEEHNIDAAWLVSMLNAKKRVFGSVAVYKGSGSFGLGSDKDLIQRVAAFLQLMIDSHLVKDRLLVSNERYKYITNATNDATYDWNLETGYIYWGEGESKLFGYTNHKSTLVDWKERVHPDEIEELCDRLLAALADKETVCWHAEYRYKRVDGSYAFVTEDGYILRDSAGLAKRMVGALKDFSAIKEKEIKILEQNRRLQQIANINSHHIRKPLANVLGIISALKNAEDGTKEELLSMLETSGMELDKIVRTIAKKTLV